MPIIVILFTPIIFLIFLHLAPRAFKWLMAINISLGALGFLALTILSFIFDARKTGANAGMFEKESIILVAIAFLTPVILFIGIIAGIASRLFFKGK